MDKAPRAQWHETRMELLTLLCLDIIIVDRCSDFWELDR